LKHSINVLCAVLILGVMMAAAGPVSAQTGGAAPAKKETPDPAPGGEETRPAPERDVPEPPVPDLSDVPPGMEPGDWQTWATGQEIEGLRRWNIFLGLGISGFFEAMAGTGMHAPTYDEIIGDGPNPAMSIEAGFSLMPVLQLMLAYDMIMATGSEYEVEASPGMWTHYDFDDLAIFSFTVQGKLRLPIAVWEIKRRHLRFSGGEEITGFVLILRAGVGAAFFTNLWVKERLPSGLDQQSQRYYGSSTNLTFLYGGGFEYRWSWGGILLEFLAQNHGQPDSAWPPNSDSDVMTTFKLRLGLGLYF
jgi:hypothetical protein